MDSQDEGVQDVLPVKRKIAGTLPGRLIQSVTEYIPSGAMFVLLNASITLSVLFFLSVFFYGAFYYTYIPQAQHMRPINFQRTEVTKTRKALSGDTVVTRKELQVDIPLASDGEGLLASGQIYTILLELNMPDSEVNMNAGMFSISATFYDKAENVLTSSSRLMMLRYRSWLLRTMETIVYSPLYLVGLLDQVQLRRIELFKDYRENVYKPTTLITVSIDNPDIQVYEATFILHVRFSGIRYYMYYWPISSAVLGVVILYSLLLLIALSSYITLAISKSSSETKHGTKNKKPGTLNNPNKQPSDGRINPLRYEDDSVAGSANDAGNDKVELRKRKFTFDHS